MSPDNTQDDASPSDSSAATGCRVLIIEDEAPVANFLSDFLTAKGCQVLVASDGESGLERFHAERPDMVICDLLLPKRNGFRLIEDFRQAAPSMPVIAMTGIYRSESYRKEVEHARTLLHKPLQGSDLETILSTLVHAREGATNAPAAERPPVPAPRRSSEPWIPLAVVPLPKILQLLWQERRTGLLTHRIGERRTVFVLSEGRLQFVRTNDPELRLDRTLLQMGLVSKDAVQRARQELDETAEPQRLGEILVQNGSLSRENLVKAVQAQLRRIIARAFEESGGETLFRTEAELPVEPITIDADLRSIIIGGSGAMRDASHGLLGHLPDEACGLVVSGNPDDPDLHLPPSVREVLRAMTGPTSTADFLAMCDLAGLRGRPLLYALSCAGIVAPESTTAEWAGHVPRGCGAPQRIDASAIPAAVALRLAEDKASGVLAARWRSRTAWITFDGGRICSAGSDDARARLGERLLAGGLIDADQLQAALAARAQSPGRPIGRILVEQGAITAPQLLRGVTLQAQAIAREALAQARWDEATFTTGPLPDTRPPSVDLRAEEIALDAMRMLSLDELASVAGQLASERPALAVETLLASCTYLTDGEAEVAHGLGTDSLSELRALTSGGEPDPVALRTLVAALLLSPAPEAALTAE